MTTINDTYLLRPRWPPESPSACQPGVVGFRNPSARAEKIVVEARHANTKNYFCDFVYANNYSTSLNVKTSRCVSTLWERIRDTTGNKNIIIWFFLIYRFESLVLRLDFFCELVIGDVLSHLTREFFLRTHCNLVEVWFRILRILLFLSYYVVPSATLMPRYPFNINTIQRFKIKVASIIMYSDMKLEEIFYVGRAR